MYGVKRWWLAMLLVPALLVPTASAYPPDVSVSIPMDGGVCFHIWAAAPRSQAAVELYSDDPQRSAGFIVFTPPPHDDIVGVIVHADNCQQHPTP